MLNFLFPKQDIGISRKWARILGSSRKGKREQSIQEKWTARWSSGVTASIRTLGKGGVPGLPWVSSIRLTQKLEKWWVWRKAVFLKLCWNRRVGWESNCGSSMGHTQFFFTRAKHFHIWMQEIRCAKQKIMSERYFFSCVYHSQAGSVESPIFSEIRCIISHLSRLKIRFSVHFSPHKHRPGSRFPYFPRGCYYYYVLGVARQCPLV